MEVAALDEADAKLREVFSKLDLRYGEIPAGVWYVPEAVKGSLPLD
jgi:hypothetical protein